MLPQPAGGRKCFPRVGRIPEHGFLPFRSKQTYFSLAKMLIVMVPVLSNKCVFEPSCNDLTFTIQNCSYFGTSLIVREREQPRHPLTVERVNRVFCIHVMNHYPAVKMSDAVAHTVPCVNPENLTLRGGSHIPKDKRTCWSV